MADKALAGVRVVECAEGLGIPYAAKLLADLGADVIKVEPPGVGDKLRHIGPFAHNEENVEGSLKFFYANSNKRSITLDLEQEDGRKILGELLGKADVWLREGLPEVWAARGLSHDAMSAQNPRLITCAVTPFGDSGPYKDYISTPFVQEHMSGNTALYPHGTGDQDKAPCAMGGNFAEYDTGTVVAIGILGALIYCQDSGEGQYIEMSEHEAREICLLNENCPYPVFGISFNREGTIQRMQASAPSYKTKDGWMSPMLSQTPEFMRVAHVIGKDEWVDEDWYKSVPERRKRCDEVFDAIQAWAINYTTEEAVAIMQENSVPMSPVTEIKDVVGSEQLNARHYFAEVDHPYIGHVKYPGRPYNLSKTPVTYDKTAPLLGADTKEVLHDVLGMDDARIDALIDSGVIDGGGSRA
ncbi:MAG: CoA transferase [Coriobacteriales bacterium]|nr:CoA transferase [Coriobacteriales bacterium]